MRNRWRYFRPILDYLGLLVWIFGLLLLAPLAVRIYYAWAGNAEVSGWVYGGPALAALLGGLVLKRNLHFAPLDNRRAMVLCALGWIIVSAVGAIPFWLGLGVSPLDAYFETVSGFTTTGITMLKGLDELPRSILFWRSFTQWLGGLGILTFFLAILYTGGSAHRLFGAESHKVFSRRPVPSLFKSLRILWLIYTLFTVVIMGALVWEGLGTFESAAHAMTTLSTGGYSIHDASIGHYAQVGLPNATLIEYTIIAGMLLGGISFFVHYRLLHGGLRAIWDSSEMRLFWLILAGATLIVMYSHVMRFGVLLSDGAAVHEAFRASLFQVVAMTTTTGYATEDIGSAYFPAAAKQIFLVLMVIGGCVGSTSGGLKILRVRVLGKMLGRQVRQLIYGPAAVHPVVVDGEMVDTEELGRIGALFFVWIALLVVGSLITALFSEHYALESASGMFSALGNIGPCFISVDNMMSLHPVVKITYIIGMLAGRLEILPLLLLVSRRTWR